MIQRTEIVANNNVSVAYDWLTDMVVIQRSMHSEHPQRVYAGIDGLKEKFTELADSFTEEYDVPFCIDYFKPSFTQTIINS